MLPNGPNGAKCYQMVPELRKVASTASMLEEPSEKDWGAIFRWINVLNVSKWYRAVLYGTKWWLYRTAANETEHYQMVQNVAKQYWSVLKGTKRYWTVPSISKWNRHCAVLNFAEWYQTLPNCTERCQTVVNGAEWFILYHSILFGSMRHKFYLKVSWMSPELSWMLKKNSGSSQNYLECITNVT